MKDYNATVRIKGNIVKTVVHAESTTHARLLLQYQYGWDSIVASPVLGETIKPKTPEQQRIDSLKATKDRANDALSAERQRQQVAKAQKSLTAARQVKPNVQ
ncbi:hypothetical protein [Limnohabitans sp.]|uniref:hypothetical protein n=1 Tax=Limnohabitans sp. TaxID=1907725 RepID=UPI002FDD37B8